MVFYYEITIHSSFFNTVFFSDHCFPLGRERCDSLPTTHSLSGSCKVNRPTSVIGRSSNISSPLSPNSYTYSSKSDDDSSYSIDEVDGNDDATKCMRSIK